MKRYALIPALLTITALACQAAQTNSFTLPPRTYVLPLMQAPTLDGTLAPTEWPTLSISRLIECAIPTQPMTPSMFLHGRNAGVQVGSDGTNLFIAYHSNVHPQYGAICNGKRDPINEPLRISQDDSVEIWLDPAPDSPDSVAIQIIGNCNGDTVGLFFPRGNATNAPTPAWPITGFRQSHGVTNGAWTAEYAIPLASFGLKEPTSEFGVRLCRSFTAPVNQCRWEAGTTAFNDPKTLCRVSFRPTAPIVRETGFYDDNGLNLGLEVRNATANPLEFSVNLKGTVAGKEIRNDWTTTLKPGETKPYSISEPIAAGPSTLCTAEVTVTGKDGTPYFTRTAKWTHPPKSEWFPIVLSRPAFTTDVEFAWNPVTKKLNYTADYSGLPNKSEIKLVRIEVVSSQGTPCGSDACPATPAFRVTHEIPLPALPEGEYELRFYFEGTAKSPTPDKILRFAHLDLLESLGLKSIESAPAANPAPPDGHPIITNASFELLQRGQPAGWLAGYSIPITNQTESQDGSNCIKLAKSGFLSTKFSVDRTDSYWLSFWMRGSTNATFKLAYSGAWRDWDLLKATPEWKEYRLLRTYTAGATNLLTPKVDDNKSEVFIDNFTIKPIINRLGTPFSSHMVMQRDTPIPIWGKTHYPNQTVTVEFAGEKRQTVSDTNGLWRVIFAAKAKGGPYTLKVSDIPGELTDIVMGDVWICAGQSNMHFGLDLVNGIKSNATEIVAQADNQNLRLLFAYGTPAATPQYEHPWFVNPERTHGKWLTCTPTNILLPGAPGAWRGFSAIGYFFGQKIQKAAGVPVGLIELCKGGTMAETWTSPIGMAGLDNVPLAPFNANKLEQDTPTANYNGTIAPMTPLPVKGIIWYQGESNSTRPVWYDRVLANLIRDWRLQFRQGDLPFYFVQICAMDTYMPFQIEWAYVRECQSRVAQSGLSNVFMAVSYDLEDEDNPWEVHPRNKQTVADRLARIALARDYGQPIDYAGPTLREMTREGNTLRLVFDHTGEGLICKGDKLNGFKILDDQMRFHDATATIAPNGQSVLVSAPGVENPMNVRYAFVQYTFPKPNLYNKAGLPASPFRTDKP